MRPVISILSACAVVLLLTVSCGGGNRAVAPNTNNGNEPQRFDELLPAISELGRMQDVKFTASFGDEMHRDFVPATGNFTSNKIIVGNSVQLPSGPTEMSAAWYGVTGMYILDNSDPDDPVLAPVPYVAPYEVQITKTGGKYWFLTADFAHSKWQAHPVEYSSNEQTIPIGLVANASNSAGTFWFAIVTYGGENVTLANIGMEYPSQDGAALPVEYHEYVEATDGTKLATDAYLPLATGSPLLPPPPYPVVVFRTPYEKNPLIYTPLSQLLGGVNAILIVQYFRGRLNDTGAWPDSEGTETLFREHAGPDHTDSVDTINWIKERTFYNGDMLLAGPSALGMSVYQAAAVVGDDIKGFYPIMASSNVGDWAAQRGGCFKRSNVEGWLTSQNYPLALLAEAEDVYTSKDDDYWAAVDFTTQASSVNSAGWHETGWFDVDVESTIASWDAIDQDGGPGAAGRQWLVVGPWSHSNAMQRTNIVGDLEFPSSGNLHDPSVLPSGWDALALNQWSFYIIGRTLGYTPPGNHVLVYFIGSEGSVTEPHNCWYEMDDWPPAYSDGTFYLTSANALSKPIPADGTVAVPIDPSNSVPTLGGALLPVMFKGFPMVPGPMDQRPVSGHPDIRLFDSSAPTEDISMAGPLLATLYVSVNGAVDSDVMCKLVDVYPSGGQEICIADSAVRLSRYLDDHDSGTLVEDQIYEVEMEIGQRAWVLAGTHQLRLEVATTNYPRFERNPGDGNAFWDSENPSGVTGTLTIHCGASNPSRITLPVFDPSS